MQAANSQNAPALKNSVSVPNVHSNAQPSLTNSSNSFLQNTETISQNVTPLSSSMERQITDRDALCNNLKQYVNNISLSDVLFIVGIQRFKVMYLVFI